MSEIDLEIKKIMIDIPSEIVIEIMHGYLNKNLLGILTRKSLEILQNATIMENSTRKIDNRNFIMNLSKMGLMHFMLDKSNGLKNIGFYVKKSEINLIRIYDILSSNVFNFNNGFTHNYYLIIKSSGDHLSCRRINQYSMYMYGGDTLNIHLASDDIENISIKEIVPSIILEGMQCKIDVYASKYSPVII